MRRSLFSAGAALLLLAGLGLGVWFSGRSDSQSLAPVVASTCQTPADQALQFVAGGTFLMGSDDYFPEEQPRQLVSVADLWISKTEITNAQFAEFVNATGYITVAEQAPNPADYPDIPPALLVPGSALFIPPIDLSRGGNFMSWWQFVAGASWQHPEGPGTDLTGRDSFPAIHIAFDDALAYASWRGARLPTEAEFEYVARAGLADKTYAWGDEFVVDGEYMANTWQGFFPMQDSVADGYEGLAPVGCFAPNALGVSDLIGNVWEWTSSVYYPSHDYPPTADGKGVDAQQPGLPVKVIKGGSFLCAPNFCQRFRPAARHAQDTGLGTGHIGFRIAKDAADESAGE